MVKFTTEPYYSF